MNRSRGWLIAGALSFLAYGSLLFFNPLRNHITAFLIVYAFTFVIYAGVVVALKNHHRALSRSGRTMAIMLFFSIAFRLLLLQTTPSLSDDINRYVWDGRVQQAGINPYLYPPNDPNLEFLRDDIFPLINHPDIRTVYPPLCQAVFRLGVKISPTIFMQRFIFVLFDVMTIYVLILFLSNRGFSPLWSVVYAWNPLVIHEFSGSGHNDSLMIFFMMLGFLWHEKSPVRAHAAWAMAALAKWVPMLMLPWILLQKKWKQTVVYSLLIAGGCLLCVHGVAQWSGVTRYSRDWVFNPSLYGVLRIFFQNPFSIKVILGLTLSVFAFVMAMRHKEDPFRYAFFCFFALLLASPVVHAWYVVWLIPFLCVFPRFSVLAWTALVPFTYMVLVRYVSEGIWHLNLAVQWIEYGTVYGILVWELFNRKSKDLKPVEFKTSPLRPIAAVIIPALNEEKALPLVIQSIPREFVRKIIVIDNGSTDETARVAVEAGAQVVSESRRGYGAAVLRGMKEIPVDCNSIVILDGDRSDFPEDLSLLLGPLGRGEADLVIGSRTHAALPGSLLPHQRFGNWLTCHLIRLLYGVRFTDMGPFRVIRRSTLEALEMEDQTFGWNVEMQIKALQAGIKIVEVPVRYRPRIGQSKISGTVKGSVKAGLVILKSIWKYGVCR